MGMHEDEKNKGDWDRYNHHWEQFHKAIDLGMYVRLVHDGPLDYETYADKGAAEAKYGHQDRDGFEKAPRDRRITTINLAQFLNPDFWNWDAKEKQTILDHDLAGMLNVIAERIQRSGFELEFLYGIFHDKDEQIIWDYDRKAEVKRPKDKHIHAYGKVKGKHGMPLEDFAEAIGLEPEFLLYPKRGRDAKDNCLAYLIHAKDEWKKLYDPHEVVTHLGKSYLDIYSERKRAWDIGRAIKSKERAAHDLPWLLDKIRSGEVMSREAIRLNDEMERIYQRHKKACDDAIYYVRDAKRMDELAAFERGEFTMTVVFIVGKSGIGKSCLMDAICTYYKTVRGWTVAKAAAQHATEGVLGDEIFFMDDVDAEALSSNAQGWKNLLDASEANPSAERYINKAPFKPRVLLISTEYDPPAFFAKVAMDYGQDISQFIRRSGIEVQVIEFDGSDGYNCRVFKPARVPEYRLRTARLTKSKTEETVAGKTSVTYEQVKAEFVFEDVTYAMRTPEDAMVDGEILAFTPWAAAEYIVRAIDENNHCWIASRPDADALFAVARTCMVERLGPSTIEVPADWESMPPTLPESQLPSRLALAAAKEKAAAVAALPKPKPPAVDYAAIRRTQAYVDAKSAYDAAMSVWKTDAEAFKEKAERARKAMLFAKGPLVMTDGMRLEKERLQRELGEYHGFGDEYSMPDRCANWPQQPKLADYLGGDLLKAYQDAVRNDSGEQSQTVNQGINIDVLFPDD